MLRSTSCGELRTGHVGQTVTLAGWVHRRRDHGNLIFIDLRDRYGLVQVVFNPELAPEAHAAAERFRSEWVVKVSGTVNARPEGTANPGLATGEIEVSASSTEVLNESKTPPFEVGDDAEVDELLRLKYRYIDLRRPSMQETIMLRHRVVKYIRDFLDERGFLEIETPILIKSTPEGARDYLVPSRLYPGKFYALPQSPQQLKQLLMVAGMDKYFQIARCFRDEDPRADRQPEHTQLDLEMSFVEQDDVLSLIEDLYTPMLEELVPGKRVVTPFPRLSYQEAMDRFASDKPDLRFGLEMADLTDLASKSEFRVFSSAASGGGIVKGFSVPGAGGYARRQLDELVDFTKTRGAQGLVYIALDASAPSLDELTGDDFRSPAARFLSLDEVKEAAALTGAGPGDLVLIVAGPAKSTNVALSALRDEMARRYELGGPRRAPLRVHRGLSALRMERERGTLGRHAPRLLDAERRDDSVPRERSGQGDRRSVRPGLQRGGVGQRQHQGAPARPPGTHIQGPGIHGGAGRPAIQAAPRRPGVRCAATRGHSSRHRPAHHGVAGHRQHPRRHSISKDPKRYRPAVRGPG